MKKFIEPILFGIALAYLVFGFCVLAHADTLTIEPWPKIPAPVCVGFQCQEEK